MRNLLIFLCMAGVFVVSACRKEASERGSGFISVVESEIDYTTRSCFKLTDGSFIICGSNVPWTVGDINFGKNNAVVAKFSKEGNLVWKKNLPGILYDLWKGIPLPDGGFALAGCDSNTANTDVYITKFSSDGDLLKSKLIVNTVDQNTSGWFNQVDFIRMRNGNFAMVLIGKEDFVLGDSPRLLIFDSDFNIINDKKYLSLFDNSKNYFNQRIVEGSDGNLYIAGRLEYLNRYVCTFLIKADIVTLDLVLLEEKIGGDSTSVPGPFVVDEAGHVNITTAEQFNASTFINFYASNYFYFHEKECFSVGTSVSILQTDTSGTFVNRFKYSGFPGYACLTDIIQTNDGGYLLIGVSNLKTDALAYSPSQILLIKTGSDFHQQWMKQINTIYSAVAADVMQTDDGGFLIGAFSKSFDKTNEMMLIKTDLNGDI